jgi:hypothetical protein
MQPTTMLFLQTFPVLRDFLEKHVHPFCGASIGRMQDVYTAKTSYSRKSYANGERLFMFPNSTIQPYF